MSDAPCNVSKQLDLMDDLNPGIQRTVAWLNDQGFETTDSGDGQTHDHECDRDEAYVVIVVESAILVEESKRLHTLLIDAGVSFDHMQLDGPFIQANYSPVDGYAFIDLTNLSDDGLFGAE